MEKYSRVFLAVLVAHTLKSSFIFAPVSGTAMDINRDSTATDRLVIKKFHSDKEGYKAYTYEKEGDTYVNVTEVYYGDRLLKVNGSNMKCDYVHYVKVFWKGDVAPFMVKFKYYSWSWVPYRLHFVLQPNLEWQKVFVATINEESETGYRKLFKQRMDNFVSAIGEDKLATYKPFSATKAEQKLPEPEEKVDRKKYVLMVVVVVVFVVVASLVVFLVKFCLK